MTSNFTLYGKNALVDVRSTSYKIAVAILAFLLLAVVNVKAQNTDLPNPTANIQTAPAGSFIIAMDNTNQATPGYFNLKAYGLVVTLMDYGVRLRWVITAGKAKDGVDISVNAKSINSPTVITAGSKITLTAGSTLATVSNITSTTGTLFPGMQVTAIGIATGSTVLGIVDATHLTLSMPATATVSNKPATYSMDTYPVLNYNFKAGPFIIYPADTLWVRQIVDFFNNSQLPTDRVNVFQTTASTNVDVRYDMNGVRPKAAILEDGGNSFIHVGYMEDAAIPTMNYAVLNSATGLTDNCYTFASEPHNGLQGDQIDSIKKFVQAGGNFLAQCHAITSYENWNGGHFETTQGVNGNNGNLGTSNISYINSDLSFSQFEGVYNANQGGSVQTWTFAAGSTPQNNFYGTIKGNTTTLANTYGASGAKLRSGAGGNVWYIGNHKFAGTSLEDINGERMYMNAFLTPALTPACAAPRVLPVKLNYFAAKKANAQQVQLTWSTAMESNTKEFIIERSANGANFSELTRVKANGNSNIESKYNSYDNAPLTGKNFYRLVTLDLDGRRSYSDIVMLNFDKANVDKPGLIIYPNPAFGNVTVNLSDLPLYSNSLSVIDMAGKTVIGNMQVTGNSIKLNIDNLQPGSYIVKVTTSYGTILQNKMMVVGK